ncbi:polysaccharide biosynthesis/export family protein [Rudanella paleaurantiibacter]|uniref:polysaccharide biosynthesis/export family protein n=1 Tax=Rudanella paleaurantiibacter TaxID=2614655 RepID=UPI001FEC65A9|nr:SLBB domain-containing protein [Rudanella paleaurantiibacter]
MLKPALSFVLVGLLAQIPQTNAQVTPSAPSAQPSALPGGARPGATLPGGVVVPGNAQPGRAGQPGVTAPGSNRGTTPANVPANGQNQTGRGANGALTPQGANGQGAGVTDGSQPADGIAPDQQTPDEPKTQEEAIEDGYQAARRREREQLRQKLFGYEIFNNSNNQNPFQPSTTIATPRNYVVGPGDALNILLYGYTEADFSQTVSNEGYVYFKQNSGIGPVSVLGLTVEAAKARIANRLSTKFVGLKNSQYGAQNTYLEVTLGAVRSIRVSVLGEAFKPGTYVLSSLSTAMNAIYQAGGPDVLGSYRRVSLIRNNRVLTTLDLYDYLLTGVQRNDVRLQDGDIIRFGKYVSRVEITGTVNRNNIFEMLPGETMDRLLFYAGDFAANAYKNRVKVTRLTDRERKVIDVTQDQYKAFVMQDGDIVNVEQLLDRFENQVTVQGAVFRPGRYSLDQNKTLRQLINNAEGLKGDAFTGRVQIVRTREDLAVENLSVNLADILNGSAADIPLQREDQIIVTSKFELAEGASVSIQGEVNQPSEGFQYVANMTLEDLILRAGGLKESASSAQIEVIRRKKDVDVTSTNASVAEAFRFNIDRDLTIKGTDSKFVLQPFDQVIVRRSPNYQVQTYARIEGEVLLPGQYPIVRKDQKISDLVTAAGGLSPFAYVEGATLIRTVKLSEEELAIRQRSVNEISDDSRKGVVQIEEVSPTKTESIGINLQKILQSPGSSEDILLLEDDLLRIPKRLETVRLQGELMLPTTVKYRPGQTFQDYVAQAGGFTDRSQRRKSYVLYANGSVDRTRKFMFFNVYPRVEPGSEIIVPKKTGVPLTPQQILASTAGTISSLLSVIGLIIALTRVAP